jgi:hypothetical protein
MRQKTIEQLEGRVWSPATYESYLVSTVHRLRKKPIGEFTVEDLRIMIGQGVGLPYLVPLALDVLLQQPLAKGDFYPGDLLSSVVSAAALLEGQPELIRQVKTVARRALADLGDEGSELRGRLSEFLQRVPA